ncbi:MAG: arginine--tRNA ligase [Candidatus Kaiserbacteria bacterium]|nr:arginine--tRNA ligase [Candidatus Kaiserbacteria bacterium]
MIKEALQEALTQGLNRLGVAESAPLTYPQKSDWGDYATGIAKVVAAKHGKPFEEVAASLQQHLTDTVDVVERVDVVNGTYLNVHLKRQFFVDQVQSAVKEKEVWGNNQGEAGKQVVIEYTSPNLFKPLHIGNLVGNVIGESLVRLFVMSGASVHRVNFPSDIGLTIAKGVWGLQKTGGDASDIRALGAAYVTANEAYESDQSAKEAIDALNKELYQHASGNAAGLWKQGRETSLTTLNNLCKRLGTSFDAVIFESDAGPVGKEAVATLAGGVLEHSDGALFFRGAGKGRDGNDLNDSIVVTREGYPTYVAKDIGNFLKKEELYPGWDTSIVVTGSEQSGHFAVVNRIIQDLADGKQIEHVATGFLTLKGAESGRGERMSSRKGNVLTAEDLLKDVESASQEKMRDRDVSDRETVGSQVAVGAVKYQILRQRAGKNIIFEKDRALSFEGSSGPYLQYTYARIQSALSKAREAGIVASADRVPDAVYAVERLLHRFGEQVQVAREQRSPHNLVEYLTDLAAQFNSFYGAERIADAGDEYAGYKVMVVEAVGNTLERGLFALGIEAPEAV